MKKRDKKPNPEWTKEDFEKALSFSELSSDLQGALRRFRGLQKNNQNTNNSSSASVSC